MTDNSSTVTEFFETIDTSTNNIARSKPSRKRKTAAEYQREYQACKMVKRVSLLDDSTTVGPSTSIGESNTAEPLMVINPPLTASTHVGSMNEKRRKTATEYQCDYRAWEKAKREFVRKTALSVTTNKSSTENLDENIINAFVENALNITKCSNGEYQVRHYYCYQLQIHKLLQILMENL